MEISQNALCDPKSTLMPTERAPRREVVVLDVETAPDRHARLLAGRSRGTSPGSPLNEIVAASSMTFGLDAAGVPDGFRLRSWHLRRQTESEILTNVERELERVAENGTLVTFNGKGFDVPMLKLRQMRWWHCAADAADRISARTGGHVDVMLAMSLGGNGRWPTLVDACAAMGFPLSGPARVGRQIETEPEIEKCERDVVGTAALFLHIQAVASKSALPLTEGLPALWRFLQTEARGRPHLERLAICRRFNEQATAWGEPSS